MARRFYGHAKIRLIDLFDCRNRDKESKSGQTGIPNLNIYDNVDAPLHYRRMPAAERCTRIMDSLEKVGLISRIHHFPAQLQDRLNGIGQLCHRASGRGPGEIRCQAGARHRCRRWSEWGTLVDVLLANVIREGTLRSVSKT
jgi:hypothetical protein